jgi:hypothetical protein
MLQGMNVISASRRTDIPAWYGTWFMNRISAGSASYRNPFSRQLHTVSLRPEEVIAIVFWTKNAGPFYSQLKTLLSIGYKACIQYTLTGYGSHLEQGIPSWRRMVKLFKETSDCLGPRFVRWRYDPIVLATGLDTAFHLKNFSTLAARLEGYTEVCHTSFVQLYQKTRRNLDLLKERHGLLVTDPTLEEKVCLAAELKSIAAARGIRLVSCCYPELEAAGLESGSCVDGEWINALRPDLPSLSLKARPTRKGCRCFESRDIGGYDTCPGGCVYCYATQYPERARERYDLHDPEGACL